MERVLAADSALFQPLLDSLGDGILITDAACVPVRWNKAAERMLLMPSVESLKGLRTELYLPDKITPAPDEYRPLIAAVRGNDVNNCELYVTRAGEEGILLNVTARPLRGDDGEVRGAVAIFRDVTAARRAVEELRASEHLYRTLARSLPNMSVALYGLDMRVLLSEGQAMRLAGRRSEDIETRHLKDVLGPARYAELLPIFEGALRGEDGGYQAEVGARSYRVQALPVKSPTGETFAGMLVIHDVTELIAHEAERLRAIEERRREEERRLLETRMMQADRLLAVGTLAAGIAHEINNPLAATLLDLEAAVCTLREPNTDWSREELEHTLVAAREGALRIKEIVANMQTLARGGDTSKATVDVVKLLNGAVEISAPHVRQTATVERDFGALGRVRANESQIGQVFLNLIMNAAQAMPARPVSDNRIFVRTRSTDTRVIVEIEDNGCGMAKDVADHMFEPFFTTKPVGVGMGLGLSICHSIVAAHGGELTFETEVGKGSLFRVSLPVAPDVAVHPVNPPPTQTSERRRLRVLIVDDDLMVSRSLRMALGRQHDVEVVNGGLPAIERLSQEPLPDVVLCDLMMPDVTGADVYAAMSPALRRRFIFITGGAFSQKGAEFLQNVDAPIVQKPFDIGFVRSLIERISAL